MARFEVKLGNQWAGVFKRYEQQVQVAYNKAIVRFAITLNERLLNNTPVWEGTTLRNWRFSVGSPNLGAPVDPEGQGVDPGHTSRMPIPGNEPRRAANEAAEREDFATFLLDLSFETRPVDIFITNTTDSAAPLEFGGFGPPTRQLPQGMLRLSLAEALLAWR